MGILCFFPSLDLGSNQGEEKFALTEDTRKYSVEMQCPGDEVSLEMEHRESKSKQWEGFPYNEDPRLHDLSVFSNFCQSLQLDKSLLAKSI